MDTVTCEKCGEEDRAEDGLQVPLEHSLLLPVLKGTVLQPEEAPLLPSCSMGGALIGIWVHTGWTTAGYLILLTQG